MVLKISFFTFFNVIKQFAEKELIGKSYITTETPSTIKIVELIDRKNFAIVVLNKNKDIFEMHIATLLAALIMIIHLF